MHLDHHFILYPDIKSILDKVLNLLTTSPESRPCLPSLSILQCSKAKRIYQICHFYNLVLYQAQLMYIIPDSKVGMPIKLPDPMVFETDTETLSVHDYSLPNMLKVIGETEALQRISTGVADGDSPELRRLLIFRRKHAMFQRIRSFTNWYWLMNSVSNAYHRMCKYFKACTFEEVKEVALLQPVSKVSRRNLGLTSHVNRTDPPPAVLAVMDCLGPMFWVDHPDMYDHSLWPPNQVVLMDEVHFGIGTDVVQPNTALKTNTT